MALEDAMKRYCDGDESGFAEVYDALAPRILGYLRCLLTEPARAEELLEETFSTLHDSRASYVLGADPTPWIYTLALRAARHRRFPLGAPCDVVETGAR